jgi:thiamine biosynthesis protein ThiS
MPRLNGVDATLEIESACNAKGQLRFQLRKSRDLESSEMIPTISLIFGGRAAIERNLQILLRAAWSETTVAAGDRYEIAHFIGGG